MSSNRYRTTTYVIAIDGPAGAGKSTIARLAARRLGFVYIDTGAMYRALTLKAIRENVDFQNQDALAALARKTRIDLKNDDTDNIRVFLDGEDVSAEIRNPGVSRFVSEVARVSGVREVMVVLQRKLGSRFSCVLDGRDIATVVFPNADKKFFLDADFKERVNRRYKELKDTGLDVRKDDVAADLKNRDTIDSTRECAPLKRAEDALYVDTTHMTIEEVVNTLLGKIKDVR